MHSFELTLIGLRYYFGPISFCKAPTDRMVKKFLEYDFQTILHSIARLFTKYWLDVSVTRTRNQKKTAQIFRFPRFSLWPLYPTHCYQDCVMLGTLKSILWIGLSRAYLFFQENISIYIQKNLWYKIYIYKIIFKKILYLKLILILFLLNKLSLKKETHMKACFCYFCTHSKCPSVWCIHSDQFYHLLNFLSVIYRSHLVFCQQK